VSEIVFSNENHYPASDGTEILGDKSTPTQAKLKYLVVMMAGSGLESAKWKGYIVQKINCHICIGKGLTLY
jgi:hypothetical protein